MILRGRTDTGSSTETYAIDLVRVVQELLFVSLAHIFPPTLGKPARRQDIILLVIEASSVVSDAGNVTSRHFEGVYKVAFSGLS